MDKDYIADRLHSNRDAVFSENPPFPVKRMGLELTNACNHSCVFCAHGKMTRKKVQIDEALCIRLLREAFDLGVREVGMYACGEPFACGKFEEYIKTAKDIGYTYVYITTNLALPSKERIRAVLDAGIDSIRVSFNGGSAEVYREVHGKDDFERALDNLRFCREYRDKSGSSCKLMLSYIVSKHNAHDIGSFKRNIMPLGDNTDFYEVRNIGGLMPEISDMRYLEEGKKYIIEPSDNCSRPFNSINITAEGLLSACCIDFQNNFIVGDLNKESLRDAWYGGKMTEFRRAFLDGKKHPVCRKCIEDQSGESVVLSV